MHRDAIRCSFPFASSRLVSHYCREGNMEPKDFCEAYVETVRCRNCAPSQTSLFAIHGFSLFYTCQMANINPNANALVLPGRRRLMLV